MKPKGIEDERSFLERRRKEILDAIIRYSFARINPPKAWIDELSHIDERLLRI